MLNRLSDTLDFQAQALSLRSERQRLIASNIANADTPGYVARDLDFAQALRQATGTLQPLFKITSPAANPYYLLQRQPGGAAEVFATWLHGICDQAEQQASAWLSGLG
jgi:flagellar basal-body rod protein FlgB